MKQPIRVRVFSDIHLESYDTLNRRLLLRDLSETDAGDMVCAVGDSFTDPRGLSMLSWAFPRVPICSIAGNGEYYTGLPMDVTRDLYRATARALTSRRVARAPLYFLENNVEYVPFRSGVVRVIGMSMWTPFLDKSSVLRRDIMDGLSERYIGKGVVLPIDAEGNETIADILCRDFDYSRAFLAAQLALPHNGPTIVMTHHVPLLDGIVPEFRDHPALAEFVSWLDDLVHHPAVTLWVYGHIHQQRAWYTSEGALVLSGAKGRSYEGFSPRDYWGEMVGLSKIGGHWCASML